jgi:membrane-bound metal-dependent hydrolase YbcI (DUF457 family)
MSPYKSWPFLSDPHHPVLSALWAVLAHGALAIVVVLPILWRTRAGALVTLAAFAGGSALDLDHVIAAGSVLPASLEHLSHRPVTHSVAFVAILAALAWALTRSRVIAWCVFAIMVSHLLFDAAGGGVYWLYPLTSVDAVPWLAVPIGAAALFAVSARVTRARCGAAVIATRAPS